MLNGKRIGVVIPAAGASRRMGEGVAKQFLEINGRPLVWHVLKVFQQSAMVDRIAIAGPPDALSRLQTIAGESAFSKVCAIVAGGAHRQDSVWNAVCALPPDDVEMIVVHDAARPFVTEELLRKVLEAAQKEGGAIAAAPVSDTVKIADEAKNISRTLDRSTVWLAQTPQAFLKEPFLKAYLNARETGFYGTDEASLLEHAGYPVAIVESSRANMKITTPEDLAYLR